MDYPISPSYMLKHYGSLYVWTQAPRSPLSIYLNVRVSISSLGKLLVNVEPVTVGRCCLVSAVLAVRQGDLTKWYYLP